MPTMVTPLSLLSALALALPVSSAHSVQRHFLHRRGRNATSDASDLRFVPEVLDATTSYVVYKPSPVDLQTSTTSKGLHFLRIQKTGGTTFGERIASQLCGPESETCKWATHLDWTTATQNWQGPVVTLLRDPVERTLSEFAFLRTADGNYSCRQAQWDFRNFTWLDFVTSNPDSDAALDAYLRGYPDNPSRNRQTLYVLGFKRMVGLVPVPQYTYDWENSHDDIVAQAKDHIEQLTAFGITDCFLPSMRAIAREMGWPARDVEKAANTIHARKSGEKTHRLWRGTVSQDIVDKIEESNAVDMELFQFAKQRFYERFGETCSR